MSATTAASGSPERPEAPAKWQRWTVIVSIFVVSAWVVWTAAQFIAADAASIHARSHVRQWSEGTLVATDREVAAAASDIRRALRFSPGDPKLWEDLGEVQMLLARRAGVELMRRSAAPAEGAASAAQAAAEAASRPAQTLEEFRRRVKQAELEAQRLALRGSAPQAEAVLKIAKPAPVSDDELKAAVRGHFEQARDALSQSIALRPTWPGAWARLAGVHLGLEQRELYLKAWRQALTLGPHEANVQAACLELVLLDWDRAEADQQAWAKKLYDDASADKRRAINRLAVRFGLEFEADDAPAAEPQRAGADARKPPTR